MAKAEMEEDVERAGHAGPPISFTEEKWYQDLVRGWPVIQFAGLEERFLMADPSIALTEEKRYQDLVRRWPVVQFAGLEEQSLPGDFSIPLTEEKWYQDRARGWPVVQFDEMEEMSFTADIFEEGNDVVVKADMPGVKKQDVDVSLSSDDMITIRGEREKEEKIEQQDDYWVIRADGSFTRSFRLPADVLVDKAEAKFDRGVLEIRIPRMEKSMSKTKKVAIK